MRFVVLFFILLPFKALAEVEVQDAWSRATAPGMPMGAVYGKIRNRGDADVTLLSLEVEGARAAEIHISVEIDGMMRMREITPFVIPAGETVMLQPGGKHFMLMGLQRALTQGETVELKATFSGSETAVPIRAIIGGLGQMVKPE